MPVIELILCYETYKSIESMYLNTLFVLCIGLYQPF